MLTSFQDSGGFQLVSLSHFTTITEEGALFASPFTGEPTLLTPEESISIQHTIGADIIMQLDDVGMCVFYLSKNNVKCIR